MSAASAADELISLREFARRDGCSEKLVRRGVRSGALPAIPGKVLPASLAGTGWRAGNREAAVTARNSADTTTDCPQSLAEAQRRQRIALAQLRQRQLDRRRDEWTFLGEAQDAWAAVARHVHQRLNEIPVQSVAALRSDGPAATQPAVQAKLQSVVYAALTDLASTEVRSDPRYVPRWPIEPTVTDSSSILEAEVARTSALAGLRRIDVMVADQALLRVMDFRRALTACIATTRQRLLALPAKLAGLCCAASDTDRRGLIATEVTQALSEMPLTLPTGVGEEELAVGNSRPKEAAE